MKTVSDLIAAKSSIKTRWGSLCCEGSGTDAAFAAAYVNISNETGPLKWAQTGFTKRRNTGSSTTITYRKAEMQGTLYKIDMDTANAPAEGSIHEYAVELDSSTGTWNFIQDGTTWKSWTDTFWQSAFGTSVQWTGEILNKEDDMPGTASDRCTFTGCQYKLAGQAYQNAALTNVQSDDPNEWGAQLDSATGLSIWDKNPN